MIEALFTAGEAAGMIGGACRGNLESPIVDVVADSRKVREGSLFVALPESVPRARLRRVRP